MVDLYINAYHFLANTQIDLERIVTLSQESADKNFFSVYVTGEKNVWIGILENGKYVFQAEMRPGLSSQRFYVNSSPSVFTSYTLKLNPSAVLMTEPRKTPIFWYAFKVEQNS